MCEKGQKAESWLHALNLWTFSFPDDWHVLVGKIQSLSKKSRREPFCSVPMEKNMCMFTSKSAAFCGSYQ